MRQKQPYTIIVPADEGLFVMGFTPEERSRPLGDTIDWYIDWELHDLGWATEREEAYKIAHEWREGLVGQYEVRSH